MGEVVLKLMYQVVLASSHQEALCTYQVDPYHPMGLEEEA